MSDAIQPAADIHLKSKYSRSEYMGKITIQVKPIEKTSDQDQLIVLKSIKKDCKKVVSVLVRKLSQLDSLITHINSKYGGHIIPFIDSDLYFQKDIQMEKLTPIIQDFLNDMRSHPYCKQDQKFYQFLFYQNMSFPKQYTYDKVLSHAAIISRKYLNTMFTRKQINSKNSYLHQFLDTYTQIKEFQQVFYPVKNITLNYLLQHQNFQDIMGSLSQMSGGLAKGYYPNEGLISKIRKKLTKIQKFMKQIDQAYNRVEILHETVRQLQANIYKGLHQDVKHLEQQQILLKNWALSLTQDLGEFLDRATEMIKKISSEVYDIKKLQISQFSVPSQQEDNQNTK